MLKSILQNIGMFSHLSESDLSALSNYSYNKLIPKGSSIIRQGDKGDALYIILSGKVRVYTKNKSGQEITLGRLQNGDYFGELSLLDNSSRSASVDTLETCNLAVIPHTEFKRYLMKNPNIAIELSIELSRRLRQCTDTLNKRYTDAETTEEEPG